MPHLTRLTLLALALIPLAATQAQKASHHRQATSSPSTWIGEVQVAPTGHAAAVYVEATVTPDHSGYQTSLYLLDLTTPHRHPPAPNRRHPRFQSPRWSPDSKQLAFTRSPDPPAAAAPAGRTGAGGAQLYLMPAARSAAPSSS